MGDALKVLCRKARAQHCSGGEAWGAAEERKQGWPQASADYQQYSPAPKELP